MDIEVIRHSFSHIMAAAVMELKPDAKLAIGPAIANGFYYDFKFSAEFNDTEFKEIEKRMKKMISRRLNFEHFEWSIEEAIEYYKKLGNEFKIELIQELKEQGEKKLSFYKVGDFIDLCRGPHVKNTSELNAD